MLVLDDEPTKAPADRQPPSAPRHTAGQTHSAGALVDANPIRVRRLRIALLGCGNVGRAVIAALDAARPAFRARGLRPVIVAALVRDARRPRPLDPDARRVPLVADPDAIRTDDVDVVIEVLGGVEPAGAIVSRFLRAGVAVITANKSLLAARGAALDAAARDGASQLWCEASVLAGVPFLGSLARRPLSARVDRITGVLNGTSNFILSKLARERTTLEDAARSAIALGLAEPDPSFDLSGRDAAEKLVVLLRHTGVDGVRPDDVETRGVHGLIADDLRHANVLGGAIRPAAYAAARGDVVDAFVGPCWLPASHPLAGVDGRRNGVVLSGPQSGDCVHIGLGAGPDVTAATIVDDVLEAAAEEQDRRSALRMRRAQPRAAGTTARAVRAPATGWLLRLTPPRHRAPLAAIESLLRERGARTRGMLGMRSTPAADHVYALLEPCTRERVDALEAAARERLAAQTYACRALLD